MLPLADEAYVDIVFINLLTVPRYFLLDRATGYASLNLESDYLSDDPAAGGGVIRVRSRYGSFGGSTQRAHTFSVAAATMCHCPTCSIRAPSAPTARWIRPRTAPASASGV